MKTYIYRSASDRLHTLKATPMTRLEYVNYRGRQFLAGLGYAEEPGYLVEGPPGQAPANDSRHVGQITWLAADTLEKNWKPIEVN